MSAFSLTFSQLRYVNKAYWRNPALAFFTFVFPLMFLVIFTSLLGNGTVHLGAWTSTSPPTTWRPWRPSPSSPPATPTWRSP